MDLSTNYLGLKLEHPFVAGACPLADTVDSVRQLEDSGASAIILRSLFEEQITTEALATHQSMEEHSHSFGEALSYFPEPEEFAIGPDEYLHHVQHVKEAVDVPVIASLNGSTVGGWLEYAKHIQDAGADALELNLYDVPTEPAETAQVVEDRSVDMVRTIRSAVNIPMAVKLSPFYTSLCHFASRLKGAGADGLVLFNRYYQADIDVEELEVLSQLHLSNSRELLLRLRWLAIVSGQLDMDLAVTGGVHSAMDAVKSIMCGAHVVQFVSALLMNGPGHLRTIRSEVGEWLVEHEYDSLAQMHGSMNLARCPSPQAYNRANYMRILLTWEV